MYVHLVYICCEVKVRRRFCGHLVNLTGAGALVINRNCQGALLSIAMHKEEFAQLFLKNVQAALAEAETRLGVAFAPEFEIEFHGCGVPGDTISPQRAVDIMYLGEDRFYRIVDIGVKSVTKNKATIFVRVSGHRPSSFEETWNTPKGNGPFKIIESMSLRADN
jgi:hypothetical protein